MATPKHPGGRPANPRAARVNVVIDPDVKRRVIICAATDGVSLHRVVDRALRQYLDRRGVK
jgi:predicted HicB family RNase H-like nuclease